MFNQTVLLNKINNHPALIQGPDEKTALFESQALLYVSM